VFVITRFIEEVVTLLSNSYYSHTSRLLLNLLQKFDILGLRWRFIVNIKLINNVTVAILVKMPAVTDTPTLFEELVNR